MLALGIDTSTPMVSVALLADKHLVARRDALANNAHGEVLAGFIDRVLRDGGVTTTQLGCVGVGLGPGPFTGLRVGIVTANAIADALGVPAYGMCSLDAIRPAVTSGEAYAVVTDARRRQLYWAVYDADGTRTDGPEIGPPDEVLERLRREVRRIIGPMSDTVQWPDAAVLAHQARDRATRHDDAAALTPMYLRRPDAREPGPPKKVTPA